MVFYDVFLNLLDLFSFLGISCCFFKDFGINRRTLASEALMLCVSIAKTATRFNNSKKLLALKEIWMPVLHKNAFQATGESVITFSDAARNAQLHLQALAALESQTGKLFLYNNF